MARTPAKGAQTVIAQEEIRALGRYQDPNREKWRKEIEEALERAVVAVLLVRIDFLDSDFIAENELPPLIEKAEQQGTRIVRVPIGYADYEESPIWNYQAAWKPENPLESLSPADQNKALVAIAREIKKASAPAPSITKPK